MMPNRWTNLLEWVPLIIVVVLILILIDIW